MRAANSVLSILAVVFVLVSSASAGVQRVTAHVKGMQCPFCTYNVEKRIKALDAVPDDPEWEASVKEGLVRFNWKAEVPFDAKDVRQAVKSAGFTPGPIEVAATGVVRAQGQSEDETLILAAGATEQTLKLRPDERPDRTESFQFLRSYAKSQDEARARVRGRAKGAKGTTLTLRRWEPEEYGRQVVMSVGDLVCQRCSTGTMRSLGKVDGVVHAEADHKTDRIWVWTRSASPDVGALRDAVKDAGFEVTHVHKVSREKEEKT